MGSTTTPPPIIVVRRKKGHGGHHGGAWKVAYADFVTAMMALFIVLWLLSSDEKVKKAVGGYFMDPTGNGKMVGSNRAGAGTGIELTSENMSKLKEKIEAAMKELPKFEQMKNNVQVTVTNEGLRIELLEKESGMFFESGNAKPSPQGTELIRMLGEQLSQLPNKLLIEGHTDAKPYASEAGYTNWELSADRANCARRVLQESGIAGDRVAQVRGFADQHLRLPADPFDPSNRRVSVLVQYREVQVPPQAAKAAPAPAKGETAHPTAAEPHH
ncbi:MAG: OmpA family protein [Acidobacteria bacterium]|nr:OmpA family protein [Acidobacteriota bacterium]